MKEKRSHKERKARKERKETGGEREQRRGRGSDQPLYINVGQTVMMLTMVTKAKPLLFYNQMELYMKTGTRNLNPELEQSKGVADSISMAFIITRQPKWITKAFKIHSSNTSK